ncbi:Gfo/Idh/MocA family protein [Phaeodactylibacter xiamenensis]|uniref:Gfo/Idh/MocA family protein n=1 Tax=Phaeodactylibacter xiamenensis TaxID=1524460 RepID=UPI003BA87962
MDKWSTSRRHFLRQSAMAAGSLLAAPALLGCEAPKKRLGIALVGLGSYSRGQLAPALQMTEHCYLAGIVTGSPEKVPTWQQRYSIPDKNVYSYDTMHEIADNPDIDVIYIVVPTGLHAEYAIRAANAGKHVWCEKPMAMNVEECQSIIDACNQNGVKLSIGYRMQHEPNTQTVIEYARTKPYGAIQSAEALAGYAGSGQGSGWRFQADMGGGALYDMGVYTINGLRYATGMEPVQVRSASRNIPNEVDVTTTFELVFPNGIKGSGKTSVVETINRLRVDCADGWYKLEPMQSYSGVQGVTSDGKRLDKPIKDQQARQMDNDALAILNGTPVLVPGEEGLRDIRIVQAIMEADRTGEVVDL